MNKGQKNILLVCEKQEEEAKKKTKKAEQNEIIRLLIKAKIIFNEGSLSNK